MSEKVTFSELVEIIAKESEHSKQFTHDFLKDFVSVINDGLESDGTVNIAGWGKFDLKRVDEREGYNPQTEEKITIPAHNKIVFKPYKDVRELINAPYAHMEPELIEESGDEQQEEGEKEQQEPTGSEASEAPESTEDQEQQSQEQATSPTEEQAPQDDFIPTAPPTQLDKEEDSTELAPEESTEQEQQKEEPEPSPTRAESETESEERSHPESTVVAFEPEDTSSASPLDRPTARRKNTTSIPMVVAASFLLIIIAGAAWYFSILTTNSQQESEVALSTPQKVKTTGEADNAQPAEKKRRNDEANTEKETTQSKDNSTKKPTTKAGNQATPNSDQKISKGNKKKDTDKITIDRGQTLWSIAEDTYGNPRLWPWIYGTNEPLEDPNVIIAGNPLDVPLPSGPNNSLDAADSLGVSKGFLATYRWYKDHRSEKAKNHLWAAKLYYENLRDIAEVQIDQADLKYANQAR